MQESSIGAYMNANELENNTMEITNTTTEVCIKNAPNNKLTTIQDIAIVIHCLLPKNFANFPERAPTRVAPIYPGINNSEMVSSFRP
ncbi:hypothetical protein D3C78_1038650 [compost metagenome]